MKLKWQWFLGGRVMLWIALLLIVILMLVITITYIIDPIAISTMRDQNLDSAKIKELSEEYINELGIKIDKSITYKYVQYRGQANYNSVEKGDIIVLGTFHEWNNAYHINILEDIADTGQLRYIVRHETRHMVVEYLKDKEIIDLTKYTEEIAEEKNNFYINMFNSGVHLLKEKQTNGR